MRRLLQFLARTACRAGAQDGQRRRLSNPACHYRRPRGRWRCCCLWPFCGDVRAQGRRQRLRVLYLTLDVMSGWFARSWPSVACLGKKHAAALIDAQTGRADSIDQLPRQPSVSTGSWRKTGTQPLCCCAPKLRFLMLMLIKILVENCEMAFFLCKNSFQMAPPAARFADSC